MKLIIGVFLCGFLLNCSFANEEDTDGSDLKQVGNHSSSFVIEGKIVVPDGVSLGKNWQQQTKILANYGEHMGFVSFDGTFSIGGVSPGSYIVEVANKDFIFEPVRVDVNSKGKIRARKLQLLLPTAVHQVPYPLRFKPKEPAKYFQTRESWRVTDFIFSPMVIMMVLPLLMIMVLPRLIDTSDPEIQREMQNTVQMPKYEMPELSEYMANWFGGGKKSKGKPVKKIKN